MSWWKRDIVAWQLALTRGYSIRQTWTQGER